MYKFQNSPEDQQIQDDAIQNASDPAATSATPQAPQSVQEILKARIASQLDPSLQQRYKDRQADAIKQQKASYQGPEAIQALKDGQDFRNLQTGLQSAANKFGSVGGDGGQKSDFASIAKGFDDSAKQQYALKDDAFKAGQANEDKAVDEGFKNGVARPLALQEGVNTLNNSDREAKQNAILDPLKVENAQTANAASKLDFKNKDALNDPTSPESAQLREFAKQYPQLKVTDATTGAQLNSLIPLVERKYQVDEQTAARKDVAAQNASARRDAGLARADAMGLQREAKDSASNDKTQKEIYEHLDPTKGRAGQFGEYQKIVDNADKVKQMVEEKGGALKNLDQRQMQELAIATNRMLGGSDAASSIQHLVPTTIMGNSSKVVEWLTNEPTGTNQQAFVKQMYDTMQREKDLAQSKLDGVRGQRLKAYQGYLDAHPDFKKKVYQDHGLGDDGLAAQSTEKPTTNPSNHTVHAGGPIPEAD